MMIPFFSPVKPFVPVSLWCAAIRCARLLLAALRAVNGMIAARGGVDEVGIAVTAQPVVAVFVAHQSCLNGLAVGEGQRAYQARLRRNGKNGNSQKQHDR